jgi:hypothetical protein
MYVQHNQTSFPPLARDLEVKSSKFYHIYQITGVLPSLAWFMPMLMLAISDSRCFPQYYTVLLMLLFTRELCEVGSTPRIFIRIPTISSDGALAGSITIDTANQILYALTSFSGIPS